MQLGPRGQSRPFVHSRQTMGRRAGHGRPAAPTPRAAAGRPPLPGPAQSARPRPPGAALAAGRRGAAGALALPRPRREQRARSPGGSGGLWAERTPPRRARRVALPAPRDPSPPAPEVTGDASPYLPAPLRLAPSARAARPPAAFAHGRAAILRFTNYCTSFGAGGRRVSRELPTSPAARSLASPPPVAPTRILPAPRYPGAGARGGRAAAAGASASLLGSGGGAAPPPPRPSDGGHKPEGGSARPR